MQIRQKSIVLFSLMLLVNSLYGQKMVNSPYSRFNFGTLNQQGSFRSLAMGGTGVAMRDNSSIYFMNPASYTGIDTTSFIFDFGLDVGTHILKDANSSFKSSDMNFNHILMGFLISKKIGVATGLLPVSNGYYYLSESIKTGDPGYDPAIGELAYIHKGTGSLSRFFAGVAISPLKNLSAGVNLSVILGELQRLNQYEFADFSSTFNQRGNEILKINGLNADLGLQYSANTRKGYFFNAGAAYTPGKNYNSSHQVLKERFAVYTASLYSPDTLSYLNNSSKDSTRFPLSWKAGLAFGKKDKFVAELNYSFTQWKDASIHGNTSTSLGNTSSLSFGFEYIPDKYSNTSFFKRIEYRFGTHYADNYLILNGVQLKEYGVSAGFAIRMRNSFSRASFFFDFTRKEGDISKGLHNENIYSAGVSLNLYDFWFIKRKFE